MNHRKAIAANGSRFNATTTALRRLPSASQSLAAVGLLGVTLRTRASAVVSSTEKTIPATAAARGDLIAVRAVTAADMWASSPRSGLVRPDGADADRRCGDMPGRGTTSVHVLAAHDERSDRWSEPAAANASRSVIKSSQ